MTKSISFERQLGLRAGYMLIVILTLICMISGYLAFQEPLPVARALWTAIAIIMAVSALAYSYFTAVLATASYTITDNLLTIKWGPVHNTLPLTDFTDLQGVDINRVSGFQGVRWPGHLFGRATLTLADGSQCPLLICATRPLAEQQILLSPHRAIALSPTTPISLPSAPRQQPVLEQEIAIHIPKQPNGEHSKRTASQPTWQASLVWGPFGAAAVLNLITFIWVGRGAPAQVDLLWVWLIIGLAAWIIQWGYGVWCSRRQEIGVVYGLAAAAVLTQVALLLTILTYLGG